MRHLLGNLLLHLSKVLSDIGISVLELLFGEFGDLSSHHAFLVLEETVGSSEEAVEVDDLLEEAELRVGLGLCLGLLLCLDRILNC